MTWCMAITPSGLRCTTAHPSPPFRSANTIGAPIPHSVAGSGIRPTIPGRLQTSSSVFDFTTLFTLRDNKGDFRAWYGFGAGIGMVGDNTDAHPWKNKAVTFLENHDTGYRTNEDGTPQEHHETDSFANNWEVEQGYAQILTHPGVPTVYWKHYFDWGADLRNQIRALINARKVAGVTRGALCISRTMRR